MHFHHNSNAVYTYPFKGKKDSCYSTNSNFVIQTNTNFAQLPEAFAEDTLQCFLTVTCMLWFFFKLSWAAVCLFGALLWLRLLMCCSSRERGAATVRKPIFVGIQALHNKNAKILNALLIFSIFLIVSDIPKMCCYCRSYTNVQQF